MTDDEERARARLRAAAAGGAMTSEELERRAYEQRARAIVAEYTDPAGGILGGLVSAIAEALRGERERGYLIGRLEGRAAALADLVTWVEGIGEP